jgi:hypothetical protein
VYVPGRHFSHRYVERVNVHNTVIVNRTYITNIYNNRERNVAYRNRGVPGAVTAVRRDAFASAQRVGDHRVRLDEREISREQGVVAAPQIAPSRESRLGAGPRTRPDARVPPRAVVERQVVVKRDPPAGARRFVRTDERSARPSEALPDNRFERRRGVEENTVREARPSRDDRPYRARPDVRPGVQPDRQADSGRQSQPDRPAAVAPPMQAPAQAPVVRENRPREDRPQRWQREREVRDETPREQSQPDSRWPQQNREDTRAVRQQERRVETPRPEPRAREVERPRVERPERQERQQPQQPSERQKPEPRQQTQKWPTREPRQNQDDKRR